MGEDLSGQHCKEWHFAVMKTGCVHITMTVPGKTNLVFFRKGITIYFVLVPSAMVFHRNI